jgi:hypothetical protein
MSNDHSGKATLPRDFAGVSLRGCRERERDLEACREVATAGGIARPTLVVDVPDFPRDLTLDGAIDTDLPLDFVLEVDAAAVGCSSGTGVDGVDVLRADFVFLLEVERPVVSIMPTFCTCMRTILRRSCNSRTCSRRFCGVGPFFGGADAISASSNPPMETISGSGVDTGGADGRVEPTFERQLGMSDGSSFLIFFGA